MAILYVAGLLIAVALYFFTRAREAAKQDKEINRRIADRIDQMDLGRRNSDNGEV